MIYTTVSSRNFVIERALNKDGRFSLLTAYLCSSLSVNNLMHLSGINTNTIVVSLCVGVMITLVQIYFWKNVVSLSSIERYIGFIRRYDKDELINVDKAKVSSLKSQFIKRINAGEIERGFIDSVTKSKAIQDASKTTIEDIETKLDLKVEENTPAWILLESREYLFFSNGEPKIISFFPNSDFSE